MNEKIEKNTNLSVPLDKIDEKKPNLDKLGRSYATGRRKESVSRVWIKSGNGKIEVNGKSSDKYFSRDVLRMILEEPLKKTDRFSNVEIYSTVKGGGLSGQAGALRHGISRALVEFEPELREAKFFNSRVEIDVSVFKKSADIILANRMVRELDDVSGKVFTRDLFGAD